METTSANREFLRDTQPSAGFRGSKAKQTQGSSCAVQGTHFLSGRFTPKIANFPKELSDQERVEQGFKKSLLLLTAHFDLEVLDLNAHPYPLNLLHITDRLQTTLSKTKYELTTNLTRDKKGDFVFTVEQNVWNCHNLYYIPVEPLYKMLFDRSQDQVSNLLLSVMAYLYQNVGVAYFTEGSSYLCNTYSMVADWANDMEGDEEWIIMHEELDEMHFGEHVFLANLKSADHLTTFQSRIASFQPTDDTEKAVLKMARMAFQVMQDHPNRQFTDGIKTREFEDDDYGIITSEHYLSFLWSSKGMVYREVWDSVNSELQELTYKDQPILMRFDGSELPQTNYNFQADVLDLIEDLCDLLNELDDE